MTDYRICLCSCHTVIPVSIYDRVAAASACSQCHDAHVQKFDRRSGMDGRVIPPPPDTSTVWVDPQPFDPKDPERGG